LNIPIRVPEAFRVIAHRGSSAYAPENSLPAFRLAREMGVGEVELDVQLAIDSVVVLCHDLVLTRYGHGDVVVEEMASDELLALDMGSWFLPALQPSRLSRVLK
jgi:glycerophosphoryl diester phosphodiesterase